MSLPQTIAILHHDHTMIYTYFIQEEEEKEENHSFNWDCGICQEKVNTTYGSYYCQDCKFVVHVNCGMDNDTSSDEPYNRQVDEDDLDPILSALKKIAAVDQNELQIENLQFIHHHNLILVNETADDKRCDGCILLISSSPLYKCEECDFTLHKSCIELPRQIKHRLHQHNLALLPKASSLDPIFRPLLEKYPDTLLPTGSVVNGIFRCSACHEWCHGFSYCCEYCDFKIDLRCASIPYRFKHDGHDHLINLTISDKTAKYWLEEHPLRLTYHNTDDGSDEYYCDICEEQRSPEYWYYYCAKCDYAAHPSCALSDFPFIKLGSSYTCDAHQHPLTFVRRNRNHLQCSSCNSKCGKLSLECGELECKFSLHWPDCVGSVIELDGSRKIYNVDNPVLPTRVSFRMPS
ncbi:uncharacterized protein LOC120000677 [Tripterygium wilfordii]|uniref:uncharacterized protein LOC120000677 n=1 Tax=Tripterygium wilfordii TaxID=458696 RepID=UPI0018F7F728|nr:uncharacterized protein LOC120000677 [Tripterygium wilfordii]